MKTKPLTDLANMFMTDAVDWIIENQYDYLLVKKTDMNEKGERKEIEEEKLRQLFKDNSNCYADTWTTKNDGSLCEGEVIQALTEDKFIEIIKKQFCI